MDLQFTFNLQSVSITTSVVSSNSANGDVNSIQHFVIQFVSDLRQVDRFPWALRFHPPIKTDHHDIIEILFKVVLNTIATRYIDIYVLLFVNMLHMMMQR